MVLPVFVFVSELVGITLSEIKVAAVAVFDVGVLAVARGVSWLVLMFAVSLYGLLLLRKVFRSLSSSSRSGRLSPCLMVMVLSLLAVFN